jgi:hypothetical protein
MVTINIHIKIRLICVVHFSHVKIKASSLVNSHIFINTLERHEIEDYVFNDAATLLHCHYGIHKLGQNMIDHDVVGEAKDKLRAPSYCQKYTSPI